MKTPRSRVARARHWLARASLGAALFLTLLPAATSSPAAQIPAIFSGEAIRDGVTRKVRFDYLLFIPDAAARNPGKKWPAILFLHGSGERGTNLMQVTTHGPPKIVQTSPNFEFIVLSPQCPPDRRGWDVEALAALVKTAVKELPIDPDRFYLTGLSMGGFGSWALAAAHPELFAAVVPICGGGNPADAPKLKNLPIWVFHGAKDTTVPLKKSQEMVQALNDVNGHASLSVYPEAGHDSWTQTYDNPELYIWLLKQKRPSAP
jgi:predicted peptidase